MLLNFPSCGFWQWPKTTFFGLLNLAIFCLQKSISSSSEASESDFSSTNAQGTSPQVSSGIATTAASPTEGC